MDFLWPNKSYWGGTGDIWWWNNYDIFLIVLVIIMINTLTLIIGDLIKIDTRKITLVIFLLGTALALFQIKSRGFDFNYKGYAVRFDNYEAKSKEIQNQILGNKLYKMMDKFDKKLPFNF